MAMKHTNDCDFHCDQVPWECTCGAETALPLHEQPKHIREQMFEDAHEGMSTEINSKPQLAS